MPRQRKSKRAEGQAPSARLATILNQGIRHEYTVVLQYLYHSFVSQDSEVAEQLQNTAINEMQHMGWLSEELAGNGGTPDMAHGELFLTRDVEANLAGGYCGGAGGNAGLYQPAL